MNRIDVANGIVFRKMCIKIDSFDSRLISQKKIYLLQSLGTDLGYSYNWYVRGPYSPALANYLFSNLDVLEKIDYSQYKLSKNAEDNIEKINKLGEDLKDTSLSLAKWYELLASLLYIKKNKLSWKLDGTEKSLFDTLYKEKPQYTEAQCRCAFETLRNYGFLKETV